jgi:hypothetical protein
MAKVRAFSAGLALLAMGTSLSAQSTLAPGPFQQRDSRVNVGIVVPLGNAGSTAERAPRLEAWSDYRPQRSLPQASLRPDLDPSGARPMRIGVNFTGDTRLMINGREAPNQTDRKGVSALGWVAIGVGVAVIVFGVVVIDAFNKDNGL